MSRNKFDFNAFDWLSAKCGYAAKSGKLKKKMADAADGEDEFEAVDQRLSESQKFSLYKDLEGYRSLWDTSYVPSKNKHQNKLQKEKGVRGIVTKTQLITGLSETTDSCCKNFACKGN